MLNYIMKKIKKTLNKKVKSNGNAERIKKNLVKIIIKNIKKVDTIIINFYIVCDRINIDVAKYKEVLKEIVL